MPITKRKFRKIKNRKRRDLEPQHRAVFNFLVWNKDKAYTPKEIAKELKLNIKKVYKTIEFLDRRKAVLNQTPYWSYKEGSVYIDKKMFKSLGGKKSWRKRSKQK